MDAILQLDISTILPLLAAASALQFSPTAISALPMPQMELNALIALKNIIGTAALLPAALVLVLASTALALRLALPVPTI